MYPLRKTPPIVGRPATVRELNTLAATAEQGGNPALAAQLRSTVARMESRQKPKPQTMMQHAVRS